MKPGASIFGLALIASSNSQHKIKPEVQEHHSSADRMPHLLPPVTAHLFASIAAFLTAVIGLYTFYYRNIHPLARFPGPFLASITNFWRLRELWSLHLPDTLVALHEKYGDVVRVDPNMLSFRQGSAIPRIYKAGRTLAKTKFYDGFNSFNPNLFGTQDEEIPIPWLQVLQNPAVHERVVEEVDVVVENVGSAIVPIKDLETKLPYVMACLDENFRMNSVFTMPLERKVTATEGFEIEGHVVPKGTGLFSLNHVVHHNPVIWGKDHNVFDPSRFYDEEGEKLQRFLSPFSMVIACVSDEIWP
ncbi:cytochrome P450 [Colletotrichum phormii]|uniref:Cytochrome P450 n=1 Tax=Colletotrichum phormii TaxID=359342 RepID=A0AAJ0EB95_9PEZI|nr:cytochrome P450 [Colletotrichum phormii]KAK1625366.1 cytochrome P450 [Colletotrichum phormii]